MSYPKATHWLKAAAEPEELTNRLAFHDSVYETNADPQYKLGTRRIMGDRVFRYCKDSGSGIALGQAICTAQVVEAIDGATDQFAASDAAHMDTISFTATLAPAMTADQYKDGYIWIVSGTGAGQIRRIRKNTVASASVGTGYIYLYDPLVTALATTSVGAILGNLFASTKVLPAATTPADLLIGLPMVTVASGYYYWAQTWGPAAVLDESTGTPTVNVFQVTQANTAGAVEGKSDYAEPLGVCMVTEGDAAYSLIKLTVWP